MEKTIRTTRIYWGDGLFQMFKTYLQVKVFEALLRYVESDLIFIYNKQSVKRLRRVCRMDVELVDKVLLQLVDLGILTKTGDGNFILPSEYIKVEITANEAYNRSK